LTTVWHEQRGTQATRPMKRPTIARTTPPLRLVMFRFLCPLCGARPGPRPLRAYLQEWAVAHVERVTALIDGLDKTLRHYGAEQPRWTTTRFLKATREALAADARVRPLLRRASSRSTSNTSAGTDRDRCPVCELPIGPQEPKRYFRDWAHACGVQTGNLLYEVGLILWAVVREVPPWCDANLLSELDGLRRALLSATTAMSGLECPICRRPTTHLYGAGGRFCRWCLDMCGGFGIGLRINDNGSIDVLQADPTRATFVDADLLPPRD
jgi:hypothetical protein